jgi:hypothetical protein
MQIEFGNYKMSEDFNGDGSGSGCGCNTMKNKTMSEKQIREEIEEIVTFYSRGNGYGDPDAEKDHNQSLEWLKEQLRLKEQQKNNFYVLFGVFSTFILTLIGVILTVYQIFFKE